MRGAITLPHSTSRLIFFFGRRKGRERERGEGRGGRLQRRRRLSTGKTKCIHIINSVLVVEVAATDQSTLFFFFGSLCIIFYAYSFALFLQAG